MTTNVLVSWLIGALFTIVVGLSSVIYASTAGRLSALENGREQLITVVGEMKSQILLLQQSNARFEAAAARIEAKAR